jgi:hypothetical protein
LARTKSGGEEEVDPQILGAEGETCAQCGTRLAVDQRYCLNCGTPRTAPRLDYERALAPNGAGATQQGGPQAQNTVGWTPLAAVVAIAILGGMLLLGVLIGQDDNSVTVTEVQQTAGATTETSATTTTPTATSETTTSETTTTTPGAEVPSDEFNLERPEDGGGVGAAP